MAAYVIVDVDVHDPDAYRDYQHQIPDTLAPFGGRFIVRGGNTEILEGQCQPQRVVVLEFPSADQAEGLACPAGLPGDHSRWPAERDDGLPDADRGRLIPAAIHTPGTLDVRAVGTTGIPGLANGRRPIPHTSVDVTFRVTPRPEPTLGGP
jgi:uncharacterized protein (DUF1330 family)